MGFQLANISGRSALVAHGHYYDLETLSRGEINADPMSALGRPRKLSQLSGSLDDAAPTGILANVTIDCPVPWPRNVFAVGKNFADHAAETGAVEIPEQPLIFTKFPSCLSGPDVTVELRSDFVDWEVELVVVIGTGGKDITEADALDHIFGLTIGQDVSDRRMQFVAKPPHFGLAKSFDTYGPMGPAIVSLDQIDDLENLRLQCSINGEAQQDGNTSDLIFGIPKLISYLSHVTTLTTGDLIFTGTPGGVGGFRGIFLKDGDVIESTIGNELMSFGTMTNRCIRVADHA
ncbi:MAG: 2,4-diketo-3-deoxy-L-fuconate hydrolase [Candidatus Aldehydirespiratoraceae bacterium]|jgi:2,4-diketo-3-deoxy-L-fuconate hydrolase